MAMLLTIDALLADKRYVEHQLEHVHDDPWGTARLMWQSRLDEINRQIETASEQRANYASVALVFYGNPVIGSTDIRFDFTSNALSSFQKLVSARLAERERQMSAVLSGLPRRGPVPGTRNSVLYIRELVRGSMGFILEEKPEQSELLPTKLKDAVESTTELLAKLCAASSVEFDGIVSEAEPRVVSAMQGFAKVLFDAGASTKISGDRNAAHLSIADIGRISEWLSNVEVSEVTEIIDGVLQGLLPEKLEFEFKMAGQDGQTLRGDVSEDLARKYTLDPEFVERLLQRPGRARIKVIRTTRNGIKTKEQRVMEALEAP